MRPTDLVTAKRQIDDFVDYVDSFYGQNDPLYPLVYQGQPLTKTDILQATIVYLEQCENDDFEQCAWGDGDSLDRERVRDILIETRAINQDFDNLVKTYNLEEVK